MQRHRVTSLIIGAILTLIFGLGLLIRKLWLWIFS